MAVVVMTINKVNAPKTAQVVKRLLDGKTESASKLSGKDERPFDFVINAICQIYDILCFGCKDTIFFAKNIKNLFFNVRQIIFQHISIKKRINSAMSCPLFSIFISSKTESLPKKLTVRCKKIEF